MPALSAQAAKARGVKLGSNRSAIFPGVAEWRHGGRLQCRKPRGVFRARGSWADLGRANRAAFIGGWGTASGQLKAGRRGSGANAERLAYDTPVE
jgi:hypothetical protein